MRSIGRMTTVAAACVMALGLAACSGSTAPAADAPASEAPATEAPATEEGGTIYLVSKGFQHRFWQAVNEGAQEAGKELGYTVEFVGPQDETKVTEQLDQLKTALASGPKAIGFAALDSKAAAPVLEEIKAAGIPVIAFDSGVESDIPLTTVQTDNKAAAAEAAKHMVELIGGKGTVGLICHDQTSQTGKQRCEGFQEYIKTNAPDVTLLDPQYAGEVGKAADTAKALIQANPELVGLYGSNEAAATGAIQGATEAGKAELKVVGFDSGKTQIAAIKEGKQAGAITQAPKKMGRMTVEAAVKAIKGEKLEKIIDSGFYWYDKANIEDDEIKPNLYE
ncbi:ABC transporter substrate-binding protein [Schaalia canis]|uniref:BMP family ABC transporter substrate-binding protein n=1 Tax=Schaalia canis TaxID=100469 RepID=A0A3P1SER5_9ACTO|nr:ABC transporter substrate-binding protein [Schaalia canis]RRC95781.1 BMP family ABC transporter substrate-binding protein [Schaalia canis]